MSHKGKCTYRAARFFAEGDPINISACYRHQCQSTFSSPFFAHALFEHAKLNVTGTTAAHLSSAALKRVFCPQCGTRLWACRTKGTCMGIALSAFEERDLFSPTEHIWVSEKVAWLEIIDGLPQHPERSPRMT